MKLTFVDSKETGCAEDGVAGNSHEYTLEIKGVDYKVVFYTDYYDHNQIDSKFSEEDDLNKVLDDAFYDHGRIEITDIDGEEVSEAIVTTLNIELTNTYEELNSVDRDAIFEKYEHTKEYYEELSRFFGNNK